MNNNNFRGYIFEEFSETKFLMKNFTSSLNLAQFLVVDQINPFLHFLTIIIDIKTCFVP